MILRAACFPRAALSCALVVCAATTSSTPADTVQIIADRDNTLIESATGEWSGGIMPFLFAGNTNQIAEEDGRRALIRFDLSAIPPGSTITSASVRLRMSKTVFAGTQTFTLHRVLADWGEGTTNGTGGPGGPSTPDSATWLHRFYPNVFWSNVGGDFNATSSASLSVSSLGLYTWTSAQLASDVQAWLDAPASNFGWMLRSNESSGVSAKRFDSRETTLDADKPTLIVEFTPPAVLGACCLAANACVQSSPEACKINGGTYRGDGTLCDLGPTCCAEDLNNDGVINVTDLLTVIGGWGPCPAPPAACPGDVNDDGTVNVTDLLAVIGAWGPCLPL